ncbi:MAG: alpha-ketoacid dehydrogenase subunit beta, partial [Thermoleophilia bacterium]|nr:alpha-ketoacid dehydrogenase subunit beta [Thermoleophilia bacterium]
KIVTPATPEDAKGMIVEAIRDPNPVLFFEHKNLYRRIKGEVPDELYNVPFGKARIARAGADVTIVAWSAMVWTALDAAKELEAEGIDVEVLDMRTIVPLDFEAIAASVEKTSKVIVLYEDTKTGGFGAEIAARIAEECFEHLDAPVQRIATAEVPIPFSPVLEKVVLPQVSDVVAGVRKMSAY